MSQKKLCQLIFCSLSVKYEPISIKIGRIVPEETLNKTISKSPLHLKYVLALPWEIWSVRLSRQRSVHLNDFIPSALWPPNSPDLNPVDYTVCTECASVQERVYRTKISDVDELKRRIISEWATLSHTAINSAVREWHQHLHACVPAGGGHFEHTLK